MQAGPLLGPLYSSNTAYKLYLEMLKRQQELTKMQAQMQTMQGTTKGLPKRISEMKVDDKLGNSADANSIGRSLMDLSEERTALQAQIAKLKLQNPQDRLVLQLEAELGALEKDMVALAQQFLAEVDKKGIKISDTLRKGIAGIINPKQAPKEEGGGIGWSYTPPVNKVAITPAFVGYLQEQISQLPDPLRAFCNKLIDDWIAQNKEFEKALETKAGQKRLAVYLLGELLKVKSAEDQTILAGFKSKLVEIFNPGTWNETDQKNIMGTMAAMEYDLQRKNNTLSSIG